MKIMIIAGEISGDFHGAGLIRYLRKEYSDATFFGIGGSKMIRENFKPFFMLETLQAHGLFELIVHLPRLYKTLIKMCEIIKKERPDALILIDYPGFNLKLAKFAKKTGVPVIFFNSPQIWAWRKGRLNMIRRVVDKMIVLFPFEEKIYEQAGMDVSWVGHPLADQKLSKKEINLFLKKHEITSDKKIFVIAPGSRPSELRSHLPIIIEALPKIKKQIGKIQFLLPLAESLNLKETKNLIRSSKIPIKILRNNYLESIFSCDGAIVASGTASLQAGLALKPFIIVYKVSPLTYIIARSLSQTKYIGMVNILGKKEIVPELLQNEFNKKNVEKFAIRILQDQDYRARMIKGLQKIKNKLGVSGAYPRAAVCIKEFLLKK